MEKNSSINFYRHPKILRLNNGYEVVLIFEQKRIKGKENSSQDSGSLLKLSNSDDIIFAYVRR